MNRFLSFKNDVDNLEAFRIAHGSHIIEMKIGWEKAWEAKQKAGYCQQQFVSGKLVINSSYRSVLSVHSFSLNLIDATNR
jgi:hypothetical protein